MRIHRDDTGDFTIDDQPTDMWYLLGLFDGKQSATVAMYVTSINSTYMVGEANMFDYVQIKRRNVIWIQPLRDFEIAETPDPNDPANYRDLDGRPFSGFSGDIHDDLPFS